MLLLVVTPLVAQQVSLPPPYRHRQLSPPGEPTSEVDTQQWKVDARGEWVFFVADVEIAGARALYSMRRNGGDLHRLSPYSSNGSIAFEVSDSARRVSFVGDFGANGLAELWSAPFAGPPNAAVQLSIPLVGSGVTHAFPPTAAGRVAYSAETDDGPQILSVPIAGPSSSTIRLDPSLLPDQVLLTPYSFASPDSSRIFAMVAEVGGDYRLWSVPTAGPIEAGSWIIEGQTPGCSPGIFKAGFCPDRLLYAFSCPSLYRELWSVPIAGPASAAVSLAGSLVSGGGVQLFDVRCSGNGARVVFVADKVVDQRFELWSVPAAGPATGLVRLSPTPVTGGSVTDFALSPDGGRVAYIADQEADERFMAWSVPIAGPSTHAVPLVTGVFVGRDVTALDFTPDSSTVVFRADLTINDRFDLYQVPANGSSAQDLISNDSTPAGPSYSVTSTWRLHPDGSRVVFVEDVGATGDRRGLGEQSLAAHYFHDAQLNSDPVDGGGVRDFAVFPDGRGTLYLSDETRDERFQLFTADSRLFGDGFEEGTTAAWPDAP